MQQQQITEQVQERQVLISRVRTEIGRVIVGQEILVDRLLLGILSGGHILLEGVPGLAKTTAVKTLAATVRASFQRIQFTPDLLPADIVGTEVYEPKNRGISGSKRTYLPQYYSGRRGEPGTFEGAIRSAGGHAGETGLPRWRDLSPGGALFRSRHPEPH